MVLRSPFDYMIITYATSMHDRQMLSYVPLDHLWERGMKSQVKKIILKQLQKLLVIIIPVSLLNGLCMTPIVGTPFTATQTITVTY